MQKQRNNKAVITWKHLNKNTKQIPNISNHCNRWSKYHNGPNGVEGNL